MTEQWQELKETIKELRCSNGDLTQQEVCSFLGVYMETLEKQMQESTYAKGTIIKSALKYLVKRQIEEGSVGFAVDNDHDHDCCWDDVLTWIEAQSCENAVSRDVLTEYINTKLTSNEEWASDATNEGRWVEEKTYLYGVEILEDLDEYVKTMPPVTPTSEDIKEAYLKGYDYGVKDWFRSKTQPCEDVVSRSELQKTMDSLPLFRFVNNDHEEADDYYNCESVDMVIRNLPSVTPRRDLAETSQD